MLVNTRMFSFLVGIGESTISSLARGNGGFKPVRQGNGRTSSLWSLSQATAILVGRGLKKRGVSEESAGAAMQYLWGMTEKELQGHFSAGRTHLMIVGTQAMPELLPLGAINFAASVKDLGKLGCQATIVIPFQRQLDFPMG